ncbi:hypothetical protein G6F56_004725 [Rhizopus delemar]|nr:hypothetical protein G6F56_004725 [Rhizopus delemar]
MVASWWHESYTPQDFNHNIHARQSNPSVRNWLHWIYSFWFDPAYNDLDNRNLPTFRNISTIDFLLATDDISDLISKPELRYVPRCDHSAISLRFSFGEVRSGPETSLDKIFEQSSLTLALRSGLKWREQGECSNAYFYRCLQQRQQQQSITVLQTESGNLATELSDLTECARQYYEKLYSPEPIAAYLLSHIPNSARTDLESHENLLSPWSVEDVQTVLNRMPVTSSPGIDGIPYVILKLLFKIPYTQQLFLQVLSIALLESKHPDTWQRSVVILLPKKGDRCQLKNWRSISLICADAKFFSRLLTLRLTPFLSDLIDNHQTGFMAGGFIGDNGLCTRLIMDIAQKYKIPKIGLMLDLRLCLQHFGLPQRLTGCITSLFFNASLCVNVNGFISTQFDQGRGLRQASTPLLKALAYADDIMVFLSSPEEIQTLMSILSTYERASNACLNCHKTIAVSISGTPLESCPNAAIYLGFPLKIANHQTAAFLSDILSKSQNHAQQL